MNAPAPQGVLDLPPAVLDALQELPNGQQLPGYRARLLSRPGPFPAVMRRVEGMTMAPWALAELWLWLVHLAIDCGSRPETTGQSYGRTVGRFLHWCHLEGVDHREARLQDFERWQRWLAFELKNRETWRSQQVFALRNFYDWRRSRGLARENIAADLRGPRVKPKPPRKYTTEQLKALFRAISQARGDRVVRDRCAVLLLLATGLRREELASLELGSIELTRRHGVVRVQGKGAKQRDIPFEGPAVDAVHEWLQQRDQLPWIVDTDALFVSLTGPTQGHALALRSFETMVGCHARAAKLRDWGIHRFRVTFATQLYDDGADIETIRALMGHESIETTRRYLAVSERARRTRLRADRQHAVLGTKPTGTPMWVRLAAGELTRD